MPVVCFLTMVVASDVSRGDESPVRVEHLGWTREKIGKTHEFRVTLVNRHDRPVWFLLPHSLEEPLAKDGIFRNYPDATKQPFGGLRFDGKGGSIIQVEFFGRDGFDAFHLPPKGRVELEGWWAGTRGSIKDSEIGKLVVLEAQELIVDERTPLEKWLPYGTMSGQSVEATRTGDFKNLDWSEERGRPRDDYPKEKVKLVQARASREWEVKFRPRGERAP